MSSNANIRVSSNPLVGYHCLEEGWAEVQRGVLGKTQMVPTPGWGINSKIERGEALNA